MRIEVPEPLYLLKHRAISHRPNSPPHFGQAVSATRAFLEEFDRQGWELVTIQPLITSDTNADLLMKKSPPFKIVDRYNLADAIYVFRRAKA